MPTPGEKLGILKDNNPFSSASVGDPWEGRYPSVGSINDAAFEGLRRLIRQKATNPALPVAALVLGEAGSGKTHLLGRILEYGKETKPAFSFAYVQPIEDPEQTFRYLLREVVVNLCRPAGGPSSATQLDRLLALLVVDAARDYQLHRHGSERRVRGEISEDPTFAFNLLSAGSYKVLEKQAAALLTSAEPSIPREFIKVLFQYRLPEKRPAAMNWLKGSTLDADDCALLQVPDRSRSSLRTLEQEARDILNSLGILLGRYGELLVVCFDRLENLETNEQIHSFGKMLEFLVDKARGMLPVACFRGQAWEEKFRTTLNAHVESRLSANEFTLLGECAPEQAMEIIRSRLALVLGDDGSEDLYPFDRTQLLDDFKRGLHLHSPRSVVIRANQVLKELLAQSPDKPMTPLEKVRDEFQSQYQGVLLDFDRHQPDRDRLRRALELYLNHVPPDAGFAVRFPAQPYKKEKYIDITCKLIPAGASPRFCVFIIDVEQHHSAVTAGLRQGIAFLEKYPAGKAFYIRDERCPFPQPPKWKATNERLEEFRARGGHVLFLDREHAARWYALALLRYAVKEGDVTIEDPVYGAKSVSMDDLAAFAGRVLHGEADFGFEGVSSVLKGNPSGAPGPPVNRKPSSPASSHPPAQSPAGGVAKRLQPQRNTGQRANGTDRAHSPRSTDSADDEVDEDADVDADDESIARKAVKILKDMPMMMATSQNLTAALVESGAAVGLEEVLAAVGRFRDRFEVIPSKDGVLIMVKKSWFHVQG